MNYTMNFDKKLMANLLGLLALEGRPWVSLPDALRKLDMSSAEFEKVESHLEIAHGVCFVEKQTTRTAKGPLDKYRLTAGGEFYLRAYRAAAKPTTAPRVETRVVPLDTVDAVDCRQSIDEAGGSVSCPTCDKRIAEAAVVNSSPVLMPKGYTVRRTAFCDHCTQLFNWLQESDAKGKLTRRVLSAKPGVTRDPRQIQTFLAKHPHAAGVLEV